MIVTCSRQDICVFTKTLRQRQRTPTYINNVKVVLVSHKQQLLLTRYICSAGYSTAHIHTQHFNLEMSADGNCCVLIFVKQTVNSCSKYSSRVFSIDAGSLSPQWTIPISFTDTIKTWYFWVTHQQKPNSTAISHWRHAVSDRPNSLF
jgi:hypothetical protein